MIAPAVLTEEGKDPLIEETLNGERERERERERGGREREREGD